MSWRGPIERSPLVLMSAADGVVRRRVKSELRETGLNLLDASVLRAALMNRWLFIDELAEALGRPRTTIVSSVERLEELRYLRRAHESDHRRVNLRLTRVGSTAARIAVAVLEDIEQEISQLPPPVDAAAAVAYADQARRLPIAPPWGADA